MIAVQPPEYFPRLSYLALLQHVDHFVLADTFRYRRQSFQDRIKLRNAQGWHWISIPIFGRRDGAPLPEVEIDTKGRWQEKHWRSFLYDYRSTMYFDHFEASLRPFFEGTWSHLAPCTARSVELVADLFGLRTPITRASTLDGAPESRAAVVEALGADTLLVPEGVSDPSVQAEVRTAIYDHPTYRQNFEGFEPGMTAIDLLLNYGREAQRILAGGLDIVEGAAPQEDPADPES